MPEAEKPHADGLDASLVLHRESLTPKVPPPPTANMVPTTAQSDLFNNSLPDIWSLMHLSQALQSGWNSLWIVIHFPGIPELSPTWFKESMGMLLLPLPIFHALGCTHFLWRPAQVSLPLTSGWLESCLRTGRWQRRECLQYKSAFWTGRG